MQFRAKPKESHVARQTIHAYRYTFGFSYLEISGLLGVSMLTLERFLENPKASLPRTCGRPMGQLQELLEAGKDTFTSEHVFAEWLNTPVPLLQEATPRQVILQGQAVRVIGVIVGINAGAFC